MCHRHRSEQPAPCASDSQLPRAVFLDTVNLSPCAYSIPRNRLRNLRIHPGPPVQADILNIFLLLLRTWRLHDAILMKVKQYDVLFRGRKVTYTLESPLEQHVLVAKTSLAPSYWRLLGHRRVCHIGHSKYQTLTPSVGHNFLCVLSRSAYSVKIRRGSNTDQKPVAWYSRCRGEYRDSLHRIGVRR